jgi:hypothetical protein
MISMDGEHRQANIEVGVFIIYLTKSENAVRNFRMKMRNTHTHTHTHISTHFKSPQMVCETNEFQKLTTSLQELLRCSCP